MAERQSKHKKSKHKEHKPSQPKVEKGAEQTPAPAVTALHFKKGVAISGGDSVQAEASILGDHRYPVVLRQAMATQLGQRKGNRYMQSILAQIDPVAAPPVQRVDEVKEKPKDKIAHLKDLVAKGAVKDIMAHLGTLSKKEKRKVARDRALMNQMGGKLGRGDLLKAMDILKIPLKDKLEAAMSGWGADVNAIKQLTKDASKKDKRRVLKDIGLVSRLASVMTRKDMLVVLKNLDAPLADRLNTAVTGWGADEEAILQMTKEASKKEKKKILMNSTLLGKLSAAISQEKMVTVLGNLNAPLADRLKAAMNGWGADEASIRKLIVEAKSSEKKKLLKDKALLSQLASKVTLVAMMSIFKDASVDFKERLYLAITYWKPSLDDLTPVITAATEAEREAVAKIKKAMAALEAHLGNLPYLKFLTILLPKKYVLIGTEVVEVSSPDEAAEAKRIFEAIKNNYGIEVNSPAGIEAIKKSYTKVPEAVKKKLKVAVWKYREVVAIEKALASYAPILGSARASSTRKGAAQEITTVSKIANAIDTDDPSGKLDTTTLGEYFGSSKNFSMFIAGEKSTIDFKDNKVQLQATAIHEIAHGLLKHEVAGYATHLDYWKDRFTKSGKKGAEKPITPYGQTNASEDLSEAMMFYFVKSAKLKSKCPKRFAYIKKLVEDWKPKVGKGK